MARLPAAAGVRVLERVTPEKSGVQAVFRRGVRRRRRAVIQLAALAAMEVLAPLISTIILDAGEAAADRLLSHVGVMVEQGQVAAAAEAAVPAMQSMRVMGVWVEMVLVL